MRSRTFLNVSLGILSIALAYHLGARTASAQFGSTVTGLASSGGIHWVMTVSGDVYYRAADNTGGTYHYTTPAQLVGNFWDGATPTNTQESFGALKVRYRGAREPQGVKPSTGR